MVTCSEGYGKGWMEELPKGHEETFGVMDMFIILIVVIVSQYIRISNCTLYTVYYMSVNHKRKKRGVKNYSSAEKNTHF